MRKRVQQLAGGKFEYARPLLSFSTDRIELEVLEGKDGAGEFMITSEDGTAFRGSVCSSNPRMECLTPQFEGEKVRIRYQFHSRGMTEGDVGKGEFFLICDQGEYNLSFVVSVTKLYAETSIGRIRTLQEFVRLAEESGAEAVRLFFSPHFRNVMGAKEGGIALLYECAGRGAADAQRMEDFLVAAGLKKRIAVSAAAESAAYSNVTETRREVLELRRDFWGHFEIDVRSDADFLVPEKKRLTEEDFLGSVCGYAYYIEAQALHAGRNFGRLYFEMKGQTFCFSVTARADDEPQEREKTVRRQVKEARARLVQLYMDYRLKKIVTGAWVEQSVELLDWLAAQFPENAIYPLMKAHAKLVNKQRQEADWIMDDFKRTCADKTGPAWGYYLYLTTFVDREPSYVDSVMEEIEEIFKRNADSSLLFWTLLFVRGARYHDSGRRFREIAQWVERGHASPYLYLEAYYLIWQDPYLLVRLGKFEMAVLGWAVKQGALTRDVAAQVMYVAAEQREFSPAVYRMLAQCYRVAPKEETLTAICGYLIKGGCFAAQYHEWYALGIGCELRIAGLYEAYLASMDARRVEGVPRAVQMYFQYNSAISYEQRAALFVHVIAEKEQQSEVYQKYRRMMGEFAIEQLTAGRISDNLAVVYGEMLHPAFFDEELSRSLARVLFTHKLTCMDQKAARAVICEKAFAEPQIVPVVGGVAYFSVYTGEYRVALEDSFGHVHALEECGCEEALMRPESYLEQCMKLTPGEWPYLLWYFGKRRNLSGLTDQEAVWLETLLAVPALREEYRAKLLAGALDYYRGREEELLRSGGALVKFLTPANAQRLPALVRRRLTEFLTEARLYEDVYGLVQALGFDMLGNAARVAICSYAITAASFEEDDFLMGFAESTFLQGAYNEVLLTYLCKHLNSATKVMAEVWKASGEFGLDTYDLEERILIQMLYTTEYTPYGEQIYESYCAGGGRELLCMAYLSYFAHSFFSSDTVVPEHVFAQIEQRYLAGEGLNKACKLALLKDLAFRGNLKEQEMCIADALLRECLGNNLAFSFYRRFAPPLLLKYHLYDNYFVEVRGTPGAHVRIHFRMPGEDWQEAEMTEMYDGIFVQQFLLFSGEEVQYYLTEEGGCIADAVAGSGCVVGGGDVPPGFSGRYAQLCEMQTLAAAGEEERLAGQMRQYRATQRAVEMLFRMM